MDTVRDSISALRSFTLASGGGFLCISYTTEFPLSDLVSRESRPTIPPYTVDEQEATVVWNIYYLTGIKPAYSHKWVSTGETFLLHKIVHFDQNLIAQGGLSLKLTSKCQHKIY
jgi:hypothetical protein